jgi:hypothetical protein
MTSWDEAERRSRESGGGERTYLRWADGEKKLLVVCGEPHVREIVWENGRSMPFDPDRHSEDQLKVKFLVNAWDVAASCLRIWEMSGATFQTFVRARKKYGMDTVFEVERSGLELRTRYSVLYDRALDNELSKQIANADLFDLAQDPDTSFDTGSFETATINEEQVAELIAKAQRVRDDRKVKAWLEGFGVTKIRDLLSDQHDAASAKLDRIIAEKAQPTHSDPYA